MGCGHLGVDVVYINFESLHDIFPAVSSPGDMNTLPRHAGLIFVTLSGVESVKDRFRVLFCEQEH